MKSKSVFHRLIAMFMAVFLSFGFLSGIAPLEAFAAMDPDNPPDSAEITIKRADGLNYQQYKGDEKKLLLDVKIHKIAGEWGYCIRMEKSSHEGTGKKIDIQGEKLLPGNKLVYACLAQKHIFEDEPLTKDLSEEEKYAYTQCMIWWIQRDTILEGDWRQFVVHGALSESQQREFYSDLETKIKKEAPAYEGHGVAYRNMDEEDDQDVGIIFAPTLKVGKVKLKKVSEKPEYTSNNNAYDMTGAEYGIFKDKDCGDGSKVETLKVKDNTGVTNTSKELPAGTYYVKELKAGKGYKLNPNVEKITVDPGSMDKLIALDSVKMLESPINDPIRILVQKAIDESNAGKLTGDIPTIAGVRFRVEHYKNVYKSAAEAKASGNPTASAVFQTNEKGFVIFALATPVEGTWPHKVGERNTFPLGTVVITEVQALEGMQVNLSPKAWTITDGGNGRPVETVLESWPTQQADPEAIGAFDELSWRGGVSVTKADADWEESSEQGDATLTGVEYTVYNRSKESVWTADMTKEIPVGGAVCTIKTAWDEESKSYVAKTRPDELSYGTYEIVETKASEGYNNAEWKQTFTIRKDHEWHHFDRKDLNSETSSDGLATNHRWNVDPVKRGGVIIGKVDRSTMQYISLGEAHLDGAVFEITNRSKKPVYVNGRNYAPGEAIMTVATEKTEHDGRQIYAAKVGNDVLPYGTYEVKEIESGTGYLFDSKSEAWSKTFSIREEGEVKELTDEDTDAASNQVIREDWHFQKKAEDSMERLDNVAFLVTSQTTGERHVIVTDENGTWGSDYTAHTKKTNSNDPTSPISNGALGVKEDGTWFVQDPSKLDCNAGTWFTGMEEDLTKWADDGKSYTVNDKKVNVDDKHRAFPYDTYTVKELRSSKNEGYKLVSFTVTLHRYTSDHDGPGLDIDYGTIDDSYVNIGTTLTYGSGHKIVPAGKDVTLTDTVSYDNLDKGKTALLKGELHLVDKDGKDGGVIAKAEKEFEVKKPTGKVEMEFKVDTSKLGGKSLVAFEYLYMDGELLAKHEDIEDKDQTVDVPEIKTTLNGDLGHMSNAGAATIKLSDTITYKNLEPGKTYVAHGTLTDKKTGEPVLGSDGKPITAETTFAPSGKDGSVDVVFTFENIDVAGKTVVAFESVTQDGVEFAVHADIEDEAQSVRFPKVDSFAVDQSDGNKELAEAEGQSIHDAVKSENLDSSYEYKLVGTLHVRNEDGTDAGVLGDKDGKAYTSELTWKGSDVDHGMVFEGIDTRSLGGKSIVVFQTLYGREADAKTDEDDGKEDDKTSESKEEGKGKTSILSRLLGAKETEDEDAPDKADDAKDPGSDGWIVLGEHNDIKDEDQSVRIPHIGTTLTTEDGLHELQISEDGEATLTDTVSYENLTPGSEYTLTGVLHLQEPGEDGKITDGGVLESDGKPVEGEAKFTPESADGTAEVTFTFHVKDLAGKSVTAFEKLYSSVVTDIPDDWKDQVPDGEPGEKEPVAEHEDIEDEGQTVHFVEIGTTLTTSDGQHMAQVPASDDKTMTLTDIVSYKNLTPGKVYTVTGTLHVKERGEDGKAVDGGVLKDAEGNEITASTTFTAEAADGEVEVVFTFDAADLGGKTVVAFESMSTDGKEFAVHADIEDEAQSVQFVKIRTKATLENGKHEMTLPKGRKKTVKVTDLVEYKNLIPGLEYKMAGEFHIKADVNGAITDAGVVTDAKGKPVTAETTFKPDAPDGSITVEFTLDGSELGDKTLVAFETLTHEGAVIATHADITDEKQSVTLRPAPGEKQDDSSSANGLFGGSNGFKNFAEIVKTGQAPFYIMFAILGIAIAAGAAYLYTRKTK